MWSLFFHFAVHLGTPDVDSFQPLLFYNENMFINDHNIRYFRMVSVGAHGRPPQKVPHWHMDYFELT